ncbi:hypothetical protein ACE1ET_06115 [Saccharicrinis sp. FJH62]|uniref:hypothetical protein n=1 Tax=Saccharicrinis sp. FJH62 TaxID=3344657 RepID=UPI0035D46A79
MTLKNIKNRFSKYTLLLLILLFTANLYGQKYCIYEFGDSVVNYETNFKNLFENWKPNHITNADDYALLSFSYVETISSPIVLHYYRNYFSGDQLITSSKFKKSVSNQFENHHEFYIQPSYLSQSFVDTTRMSVESKRIFTSDFTKQINQLMSAEINIDSSNIYKYNYEYTKVDTIITSNSQKNKTSSTFSHIISENKLSNSCGDFMSGEKRFSEISDTEQQQLLLAELKTQRLIMQKAFNDIVELGDVVYVVNFRYFDKFYSNYVVCSKKTKEVILDYFFMGINIEEIE